MKGVRRQKNLLRGRRDVNRRGKTFAEGVHELILERKHHKNKLEKRSLSGVLKKKAYWTLGEIVGTQFEGGESRPIWERNE